MTERLKRVLLRAAIVLAAAYVLIYVVGANVALNTDFLRSVINRKPEKILVEWDKGWTLLPGLVHVKGLRVRGQTRATQWQVRLPEGSIRISLTALASKIVRIGRARGGGFEFRLRRRQKPGEEDPEQSAHDPEIAGFSNPPDPAPEDIYPPKKKKKKWLIDLSNLDFRGPVELWLGGLAARGEGRVAGAMLFQLGGDLEVPRGIIGLERALVTINGGVLAEGVELDFDGRIAPFAPKQVKGMARTKNIFATVRLSNGTLPDLRALNAFLPTHAGIALLSGSGAMNLDLTRDSAEEGLRGRYELSVDGARLRFGESEIAADLGLDLRLNGGGVSLGWFDVGETIISLDNVVLPQWVTDDKKAAKKARKRKKTANGEDPLWWGRLVVERGQFDFGQPSDFDIVAGFEVKDTRPLLQLFFDRPPDEDEAGGGESKSPKWIMKLPNIQDLSGRVSIDLDENGLILDDVVMIGDKMTLGARIKSHEDTLEGQVYVRYLFFHIGVALADGERNFKFIKPKRWFLEQPELDNTTQIALPRLPDDARDGADEE